METVLDNNNNHLHAHKEGLIPGNIWLIITVRNASQYIENCLKSILDQDCKTNIKIAICDDASSDTTDEIIQKIIDQSSNPEKFYFIRNKERKYKLRNVIQLLNNADIKNNDICCFLDGDDSLTFPNSLQIVLDTYINTGCWVTYGSYRTKDNLVYHCREMTQEEKNINNFRSITWIFSHMFTCYYFLWKSIPESQFVFDEEVMYQYTADMIINFSILDLAEFSRIKYIPEPIYIYNTENILNEHKINVNNQRYVEYKTRNMKKLVAPIFPY